MPLPLVLMVGMYLSELTTNACLNLHMWWKLFRRRSGEIRCGASDGGRGIWFLFSELVEDVDMTGYAWSCSIPSNLRG